ncbi:hypothetical protein MNBD_GAMMA26-1905 [hydrothermal vent metagenome]|uniref:Rhs-family protein n=1 Tax=hydrothermal vent metagenome TaxID=652676 RepID=A0A3B1BUC9_9ZZZZ
MSAALKLIQEPEDISEKPLLGKKWPKPRLVWENPKISDGTHKEKPKVKPDASYGRVHYNYFRTYDPATGRYITSDPIGLRGGMNTYAKIWIDPNKLVVRRIEKSRIINGSVVQEIVNFNNVKVGHTIPSSMFEPEIVDCSR